MKKLLNFASIFLLLSLSSLQAMSRLRLSESFPGASVIDVHGDLSERLEQNPDLTQQLKAELKECRGRSAGNRRFFDRLAILLVKQMNKLGYECEDLVVAEQNGLFLSYLYEMLEEPEVSVSELYGILRPWLRPLVSELREAGYRLK